MRVRRVVSTSATGATAPRVRGIGGRPIEVGGMFDAHVGG
jgi:hypothetical protein